VSTAIATVEQPLRTQIDRVEEKLGGLANNLRGIDGELSKLAPQREQFGLVQNVCESLEKLRTLGHADLFWGEHAGEREADRHLGEVRGRLGEFTEQIKAIEDRRRVLLEEFEQGQHVLHLLEGDLFEVQEEEEERRREWVVEREVGPLSDRPQRMPWSRLGEDDTRFRRNLLTTLMIAAILGVVVPLITPPLPEPEETLELPERIVRFIELDQRRAAPALPPVAEQPKPEEPEKTPEPVVANNEQTEVPPAPAAVPEPAPRQRAEAAGILAFRESFANIAQRRPDAQIGSQARIGNSGDGRMPTRSLVTTLAPGSSGGINLASFSRQVGGDGGGGGSLEGVEVGRVTSNIGDANGPGGAAGVGDRAWGGAAAGRTDEEIQIVFDRYKASLYRLYNRELRNIPTLRGQMVLKLTIEPSGVVSFLELVSSDMNAPALAAQVLERVRTFDFGAKDVAAVTIVYPIDFLPAA
jgi:outer membrane biosynthesis protein TonB